jgi:hypothetical protein
MVLTDSDTIQLNPTIGLAERLGNESFNVLRDNAEQALKQAVVGNLNLVFYQPDFEKNDD